MCSVTEPKSRLYRLAVFPWREGPVTIPISTSDRSGHIWRGSFGRWPLVRCNCIYFGATGPDKCRIPIPHRESISVALLSLRRGSGRNFRPSSELFLRGFVGLVSPQCLVHNAKVHLPHALSIRWVINVVTDKRSATSACMFCPCVVNSPHKGETDASSLYLRVGNIDRLICFPRDPGSFPGR